MPSRLGFCTLLRPLFLAALLAAPGAARAGDAQDPIDRVDPAIITEESRDRGREPPPAPPSVATPQRAATASIRPFVAGAIRVEGAQILAPSAFAGAIEPFLGRTLDREALGELARSVAQVARRSGFGLATAWIPPQDVAGGLLRVRIDEGRIDAVEASGPAGPSVVRLLSGIADGRPVRTADLERQLLIAGDQAGVTLGRPRLIRREGRNILRIETGFDRIRGRAAVDNWGTDTVGPVRARPSVDINGVIAFGDQLTLGITATPFQPRELQFFRAHYSVPVGSSGTEASIGGYVSRSQAGAALRDRDLEGRGAEIEAALMHPLIRSRSANLTGKIVLGLRDSELTREDRPARDDRIATINVSLYGRARIGRGHGRAHLSIVQGLDVLGATERGDPVASRVDAGGAFSKLVGAAEFDQAIGAGFSFYAGAEGQTASRPLLASEEMGLGGRNFGRGYDYREFAGDRGIAGTGEIRFDLRDLPRPLRRAQFYAYADAGVVDNFGTGSGGGTLASAGGGVRMWLRNHVEAGIEIGVPLLDGQDGDRPDPRFSFSLSSGF